MANPLANLPSKGYFMNVSERFVLEQHKNTSFLPTSNTLPSESQIISTDKTNILIRSLLLRRQRHTGPTSEAGNKAAENRMEKAKKRASDDRPLSPKKRLHLLSDDEDGTENMVDEIAANSHPCSSSAGRVPSDEEADEQDSDAEVHGSRQKGASSSAARGPNRAAPSVRAASRRGAAGSSVGGASGNSIGGGGLGSSGPSGSRAGGSGMGGGGASGSK